ncbi:MAG: peptidylprolyl isomerase, partial [Luteolibacter sp.]
SQFEIERLFGQEFAKGLPSVETGSWQGPVRSGFGVHLVFISDRIDGRLPPLSDVREAVARDWSNAKREESNEAIYDNWRAEYEVSIEEASTPKEDTER